jgi:hypothetical protein
MRQGSKLYHIEYLFEGVKPEQHGYYTNLKTLCRDNPKISKSFHSLSRLKAEDFPFKDNICIIRKGFLKNRLT